MNPVAETPPDPPAPPAEWSGAKPPRPTLTVPQILSFVAFLTFVVLAIVADDKDGARVSTDELKEVGTFTMFLIGAMLPSDALIRFGRNLLFQTVDDADEKAKYAPATTLAQILAFSAFVVIVLATIFKEISGEEFKQVIDVGRVLVIALLPSDAGIRFGRALYFRSAPTVSAAQLKRV
jgi:hypothetical protein